ncbi:DUF1656 domain-containing protein [Rhodoblastus acidophilus]|uniref:DUF1656 domain-containing protein n=1 Tax=Candidatus Rhodoblastus alkanivorans TaxID=2954117 RepID=A0ABS9Z5H7_9HYPH|nr:DUF1656 domain-containing protein [Candidatus Rhodoblastus alkanivorans]MCI4678398.1 DUF1656 domain-containing protein [Candidatus Rhodoblastus alkanivorans]MCI4682929.1 DUF1656 domain-containing protein [Candidatus Rhodoblastus alkanivorans]MDI4640239.1 DUF1656 domain-containing protein [Rhodoblastus acidophilus]
MTTEINFFGVYVAPFVGDLAVAFLLFLPLRWLFARAGLFALFWHVALVELCLFVAVLGFTVYLV